MEQKYEKYLPIGSVVLLKGAKKKLMVTGFCIRDKRKDKDKGGDRVFDYIGCLYPEGVLDTSTNILFDHVGIDKIYAIGYSDEEEKQFKQFLREHAKSSVE